MTNATHIAGKSKQWTALYAGDTTLVLEFGQQIDSRVVEKINQLDRAIRAAMDEGVLEGIRETVPTFRSLALIYDPARLHPSELIKRIEGLENENVHDGQQTHSQRHWNLPVLYGGEYGPDLDDVAEQTGMKIADVIKLHSECTFTAYMLGFLPGYAFLGDTPEQLHLPRRTEPRMRVPAGSVAIAKQLTGIYPWESPGGWHIIGNCPVPMFDAQLSPPALLKAGDRISFSSINQQQFNDLGRELQRNQIDRGRWAMDKE